MPFLFYEERIVGETMNAFVHPNEHYTRDYDIRGMARHDLAFYLARTENINVDEAYEFFDYSIKKSSNIFELKDPKILILQRLQTGDRELVQSTLNEFLANISAEDLIVAPNMTCYIPPSVKVSVLAEYIIENMNLRKKDKGQMFLCEMRQEMLAYAYFKTLQESRKIKNNSVSGMHASPSTPGYNKSSHSSLTSGCRCATSYSNSSNEKFLGGLRHYYVPNIVFYHIIAAARHSNIAAIKRAVDKFNLHLPTADDCMEVVRHSTRYYWNNSYWENQIYDFLKGLSPFERAAFAYTGDLYHIEKFNHEFIVDLFNDFTEMKTGNCPDAEDTIKSLDDNFTAISSLLCAPLIAGTSLKDAAKDKPEAFNAVALTSKNLKQCLEKYVDFVHGFLRQDYLPNSIAAFRSSYRKSVPTSDTDSTISSAQYWARKFGGEKRFSHKANSVQYIITFFVAGMTENVLKNYSGNLGIKGKDVGRISMKNEYIFPTYCLTSLAKHYFAYITAGEGNVYEKKKTEVKGVNLRSSNAPPEMNEAAHALMRKIMDMRLEGKDIYLKDVLDPIVEQENKVVKDILNGQANFMNSMQIKPVESYTQGNDAPAVKAHKFWNEIFADKYGPAPTPPYRSYSVNVTLNNKSEIVKWLAGIKDETIRRRLENWVNENGWKKTSIFRLPKPIIQEKGIPEEFFPIVDLRNTVIKTMKPFYYVLEACGLFMMNKYNSRLLTDEYVDSFTLNHAGKGHIPKDDGTTYDDGQEYDKIA